MAVVSYSPAGPITTRFHNSTAFVRGIMGPVGCVSGDTLIVTERGLVRIDALTQPTRVLSYDATSDQFLFVLASAAFPKGMDALYRVLTTRGEWRAAGHHRVLCADGTYQPVQSLGQGQFLRQCSPYQPQTNTVSCQKSWRLNALHYLETLEGSICRYVSLFRQCGQLLRLPVVAGLNAVLPQSGAPPAVEGYFSKARTRLELPYDRPPTRDCPFQEAALLGGTNHFLRALYGRISRINRGVQRFLSTEGGTKTEFQQLETYTNSLYNGAIISITREPAQEVYWDMQVPSTNNYVTADGAIHHNSGKSVACCMDVMMHALKQPKGSDGIARSRVVIVRNTFPELKSTTIRTWLDWFPEEVFGKVRWDSPITQKMTIGSDRELEAIFLALDRPEDVKKLLSLETSWIWLNEAKELPKAVLDAASGRVGRYPSARSGSGIYHPCIIMDTNPPDDDHWYYRLAEEMQPDNHEFFRQPSGLSENAENLAWLNQTPESIKLPVDDPSRRALGRVYYERMVAGKNEEWIKVFVHGDYGSLADGRPVYPEYNDVIHAAKQPMQPYNGLPLYLGFDFGLTPACVVAQITSRGQMRVYDELIGEDIGLSQFVDTQVLPLLHLKYPGFKIITFHDPAGVQRSQADEVTCRQILRQKGLNPSSVSSNNFTARRESVSYFLSRLVDGEPALVISPNCKTLRKGLIGDYRFKRINVPGEEKFKDVPDKNMSSHVNEALQYVCLHFHVPGRAEVRKRLPSQRAYRPALSAGY